MRHISPDIYGDAVAYAASLTDAIAYGCLSGHALRCARAYRGYGICRHPQSDVIFLKIAKKIYKDTTPTPQNANILVWK